MLSLHQTCLHIPWLHIMHSQTWQNSSWCKVQALLLLTPPPLLSLQFHWALQRLEMTWRPNRFQKCMNWHWNNWKKKLWHAVVWISFPTPYFKLCSHGLALRLHHSSVLVPLYRKGWASAKCTDTLGRRQTDNPKKIKWLQCEIQFSLCHHVLCCFQWHLTALQLLGRSTRRIAHVTNDVTNQAQVGEWQLPRLPKILSRLPKKKNRHASSRTSPIEFGDEADIMVTSLHRNQLK